METNRSSAPAWTFGYAAAWGGLSAIMPLIASQEYPSRATAIVTSVLGVVVIGLGFGVFRRKRFAAWALVAFAVFDVGSRIFLGHSGYIMPRILFAFVLSAALALRKEARLSTTQN